MDRATIEEAIQKLRLEATLQAGYQAMSARCELSDMLDGAASIIEHLLENSNART